MTMRVLICDDSAMARKQMVRAFPADWPVETLFAVDGHEALARIREGQADTLFLDLNMPGLDGYGVLEAINREDLPVLTIVVSGDIQPQARERVRKMGAIDFIRKPTDPDLLAGLLQDYGLYRPGEAEAVTPPADGATLDAPLTLHDFLQEISNVAMGRAADLLARLLNVFVQLPVPRVAMIERSELSMALSAAEETTYSAVCQGFIGAGVAGEALLLFSDASFKEMAHLLRYEDLASDTVEVEMLMDLSSILFGAFLKGFGDQLDLRLSLGHPTVLGQHRRISDLLEHHSKHPEQLTAIEINYHIEEYAVSCDLLVLLTEDSIPHLEKSLFYLTD